MRDELLKIFKDLLHEKEKISSHVDVLYKHGVDVIDSPLFDNKYIDIIVESISMLFDESDRSNLVEDMYWYLFENFDSEQKLVWVNNFEYDVAKIEDYVDFILKFYRLNGENMSNVKLKVKILDDKIKNKLPEHGTKNSSGLDLFSSNKKNVTIKPGEFKLIGTNVAVDLPPGFDAEVGSKSGLSAKYGIFVLNSPGRIDNDYKGEIKVILANFGDKNFIVEPNMKIAQLTLGKYYQADIEVVSELEESERGDGGFGSTGLK